MVNGRACHRPMVRAGPGRTGPDRADLKIVMGRAENFEKLMGRARPGREASTM